MRATEQKLGKPKRTGVGRVRGPRRAAETKQPADTGRGNAERTRALVLSSARSEFALHGFAGARIDAIARGAGVNKQAIYYHFGSKDALFRATLMDGYRQTLRKNQELDVGSLPPREAMARIVEILFDRIKENRDLMALILDENRYEGRHLSGGIRHVIDPLIAKLDEALRRGEAAGLFVREIEAVDLYVDIVSMVMLYFSNIHTLSSLLGRDLSAGRAIQRRKRHVTWFILSAIAAKPAAEPAR